MNSLQFLYTFVTNVDFEFDESRQSCESLMKLQNALYNACDMCTRVFCTLKQILL